MHNLDWLTYLFFVSLFLFGFGFLSGYCFKDVINHFRKDK